MEKFCLQPLIFLQYRPFQCDKQVEVDSLRHKNLGFLLIVLIINIILFPGPDGFGYIFKDSLLRQIDKRGKIVKTEEKLHIWDRYKGGPQRVEAVAFHKERRKTYMFLSEFQITPVS